MALIVGVRARIARRRPAVWANAQKQMRFVVGDDAPDHVVERLAAGFIRRSIWRGESRWHPELVTRQPVVGVEQLRTLQDAGKGFIINFMHHGDSEGITPSLAWAGIPNLNLATSAAFDSEAPIWLQQAGQVVKFIEGGAALDVAVGSAGVRKELERGSAVAIATDQPGHTPVRYLGHELLLSSGAARIAKQTNVPVVLLTAQPNPEDPDACAMLKVAEILKPEEFDSVESLLEAMIRLHEQAVLAWPEAADHPLRMLDRSLVKPPARHKPDGAAGGEVEPPSEPSR